MILMHCANDNKYCTATIVEIIATKHCKWASPPPMKYMMMSCKGNYT